MSDYVPKKWIPGETITSDALNHIEQGIKLVETMPGVPGKDGKEPYDIAVENGYTGTEADFNAAPALVVVYQSAITIGQGTSWTFWIRNMTSMDPNVSGQPFISTRFSASGNSLTLTGDSHDMGDDAEATLAMNSNGITYNVLAVL